MQLLCSLDILAPVVIHKWVESTYNITAINSVCCKTDLNRGWSHHRHVGGAILLHCIIHHNNIDVSVPQSVLQCVAPVLAILGTYLHQVQCTESQTKTNQELQCNSTGAEPSQQRGDNRSIHIPQPSKGEVHGACRVGGAVFSHLSNF